MFLKVIEKISSISGWLSGIGVYGMSIIIFVDVILRYLFHEPLLFSDEYSVYCMIFTAFIGAALTMKMKRHISVDLLYLRLPKKVQIWLDVFTTILGTVICILMTYYTTLWVNYTHSTGFISPGIFATPMWIPMSFIPIGLFFWSLQYIVESIKVISILSNHGMRNVEGVSK